jgi:hypothetical protein
LRRMSEQHDSEIVGRSTRISVSLDGSLHDFIQRTAGELHRRIVGGEP